MQVQIQIVAMDHENGLKKTMTATVEVPKPVLALHEMMAGDDPGELVTMIANAVFLGAKRELDAGQRNRGSALVERVERGGPIGSNTPRGGKPDPIAEALGLDIIDRMGRAAAPAQPAPAQRTPAQTGPGPVGFPTNGPGPIGFPTRR